MNMTAQMDQAAATLRDFAPAVGGYLKHLIESGLERGEAFVLVRDFHRVFWETTFLSPGSEEEDEE